MTLVNSLGGAPNRVVTAREQKEILRLIQQDEVELSRLHSQLKDLEKRVDEPQRRVRDYRNVLAVAEALHASFKRKHQSAVESSSALSKLDLDAVLSVDDENVSRVQRRHLVEQAILEEEKNTTEMKDIADKIGVLDVRIRDIQLAIEGEETILSMLEVSKGGIRESIERRKTQLSVKKSAVSFRRAIPAEIWEEIFHLVIVEEEFGFKEVARNGKPPLPTLKLAAVCRYWRTIIMHRPKLWRYVAIPHYMKISSSQKDRINYYAQRLSKLSPLAYTYRHDFAEGSFPVDFIEFIRGTFTDYGTLELLSPNVGMWRGTALRRLLENLSPNIDVLRIIAYSDHGIATYLSASILQKIKQLEIDKAEVKSLDDSSVSSSITSFYIRNAEMSHSCLRQWLKVMPGLKYLKFLSSSLVDCSSSDKATLALVESLECDLDQYPRLSRAISTPNVNHLVLEYESFSGYSYWVRDDDEDEDEDEEYDEIQTPESIRSLTIRAHSDAEELSATNKERCQFIFKHFEHITCLKLDGKKVGAFLEHLPTTEVPLANLQDLVITNSDIKESTLSSFLEGFVDINDKGLTLVTEGCSNLELDAIQRLQELALNSEIM